MDDDPLVLANTLAMLEDAGHRPVPAGSGKEALAILHRGDLVDVVITDQVMPHMNSVQLAGAIKIEWPDLPVVLATGYEDMPPGDGTAHLRLSKPYTQEELTQAILGFSHRTQESGHIPPFPTKCKGRLITRRRLPSDGSTRASQSPTEAMGRTAMLSKRPNLFPVPTPAKFFDVKSKDMFRMKLSSLYSTPSSD